MEVHAVSHLKQMTRSNFAHSGHSMLASWPVQAVAPPPESFQMQDVHAEMFTTQAAVLASQAVHCHRAGLADGT